MWRMSGALLHELDDLQATARLEPDRCTRRHGSACTACLDQCPKAALTLAPPTVAGQPALPQLDARACIGCGLCIPACPTEAFSQVGLAPADLVRGADEHPRGLGVRCGPLAKTELESDDAPTGAVLGVWCLAALQPEAVAAAAARMDPDAALALIHADCADCPVAAGTQVSSLLAMAQGLSRQAQGAQVRARQIRPGSRPERARPAPVQQRPDLSRRLLLAGLLGRPAATAPHDVGSGGGSRTSSTTSPAPGAGARAQPRAARAARTKPVIAAGAVTQARGALLAAVPATGWPLARPYGIPGCNGCGACTQICPTDALGLQDAPGQRVLIADPESCLACGECVRVCPEDVLSLGCPLPTTHAGGPRPHEPTIVARAPHRSCERCGLALVAQEQRWCTSCESRQGMLDDVWQQAAPSR